MKKLNKYMVTIDGWTVCWISATGPKKAAEGVTGTKMLLDYKGGSSWWYVDGRGVRAIVIPHT